jgi:hypothetical protein
MELFMLVIEMQVHLMCSTSLTFVGMKRRSDGTQESLMDDV